MTRARAEAGLFGIRPEAARAWLTLGNALQNMQDHGRTPVCAANPEDWSADATVAVRAEAADACTWCPALPPCLAFAIANTEKHGVFGGRDFTQTRTKKETAA